MVSFIIRITFIPLEKKTNIITISKYQYHKSDKGLFIIYADLECMIERLMDIKIILKIHSHQSR